MLRKFCGESQRLPSFMVKLPTGIAEICGDYESMQQKDADEYQNTGWRNSLYTCPPKVPQTSCSSLRCECSALLCLKLTDSRRGQDKRGHHTSAAISHTQLSWRDVATCGKLCGTCGKMCTLNQHLATCRGLVAPLSTTRLY